MQIITYPNVILRQASARVEKVDHHLQKLLKMLEENLNKKSVGVGLAAPQLGTCKQVIGVMLERGDKEPIYRYFVNPKIVGASKKITLGEGKAKEFEGCLSVPKVYAPVYRPEWIEVEYDQVVGRELQHRQERFEGFGARVMAHETDHLKGVLFVDHVLEQGTPLFYENAQGELEKISREKLFELFGEF
jgi:peptide deformylase